MKPTLKNLLLCFLAVILLISPTCYVQAKPGFDFKTPFSYFNSFFQTIKNPSQAQYIYPVSPGRDITFAVGGDIMMARNVTELCDNLSDYTFPFRYLPPVLAGVDIKLANLEGGITNSTQILKPVTQCNATDMSNITDIIAEACCGMKCHFKNSPKILEGVIDYAGFNILTIENNHMDDFVNERNDTAAALNARNYPFFQYQQPYFISQFKGCDIQLFAYNFIDTNNTYNEIQATMMREISEAPKTSFKMMYVHGGVQYNHSIQQMQQNFSELAVDFGADMIIWSHAHVTEPYVLYKGKHIIYGLGNFIFDYDVPIDDTRKFYFMKFTLQECINVVDFTMYDGRINQFYQATINATVNGTQTGPQSESELYYTD